MKKSLLILLVLLTNITLSSQAQTDKPIKIKITLSVEIAAPRRDCLSGFGFCNFSASPGRIASTGFNLENGIITMYFDRSKMGDALENEFRNAKLFPIDASSKLPSTVWLKLGERNERTLKPGNYVIESTPEYFIVNIPIE